MDKKLILHTGSDCLEQQYAEYITNRVGADMCIGLGELKDLTPVSEIICVFRYEYQNASLPETAEDLLFERAGELAGKKVKFVGFGGRSDGFYQAVAELSDMCGVKVDCRFLVETARIYAEQTDREDNRVIFVRELVPEKAAEEPAAIPETKPEYVQPAIPEAVQPAIPEAVQPAIPEAVQPAMPEDEQPAITEALQPEMPAAVQPEEPEEIPDEKEENDEEIAPEAPAAFMDEEALAAAVRAVIEESEETISQVTDEVSAEFPDEEEAEHEEPIGESEKGDGGSPEEESRIGSDEIVPETGKEDSEEFPGKAFGEIRDSGNDPLDDWDPGKSSRNGSQGGRFSFEEPYENRKEEPAGEISPQEEVSEKSSQDAVGRVSWEFASGEALKTYIRRANGEEPWPEEPHEFSKPDEEPRAEKSYRFVDESVTEPPEAAYEPPLGLSDLEAMEAEEAAEAVNRRERRKERSEREAEPEEGIIARAAAKILAFFKGSREEDEDLDFGDEEKEVKTGRSGEKSFFEKLREDVGVYDEDDEEEAAGDYDEDDEEEFEDDEDFSDSFEEDEDEEDF